MSKVIVYLGTGIHGQYDEWQPVRQLPLCSYIHDKRERDHFWYYIVAPGQAMPINDKDIPPNIKMLRFLLNE